MWGVRGLPKGHGPGTALDRSVSLLLALWLVAAPGTQGVSGVVFDDQNANGRRDLGEAGLPGVVVSDGTDVTVSGSDGLYHVAGAAGRHVFVIEPGDRRALGGFHRPRQATVDFPLTRSRVADDWRFAHLSDTHVHAGNALRLRRALEQARRSGCDFAVVSGDLVKDALRVSEAAARGEYALFVAEAARAELPVRSALGNHEVFAIERHESLVATTHPSYGKKLYEEILGPRYYAFNRGAIHFLVLDTVGIDDLRYYGFLDPEQLEWVKKELTHVPQGTPVVTVGHIPLRSGVVSLGYFAEPLNVNGEVSYRHIVRNAEALGSILKPYRWTLALQGHTHTAERLRLWDGGTTRYHTAPAVDRTIWAPGPSGFVLYTVSGDQVDDGEFRAIDED